LFKVYKRQTDNDNPCKYENDGGILKSNVTEMNIWKGPSHTDNPFNWFLGENVSQKFDEKEYCWDQAGEEMFLSLHFLIFIFN